MKKKPLPERIRNWHEFVSNVALGCVICLTWQKIDWNAGIPVAAVVFYLKAGAIWIGASLLHFVVCEVIALKIESQQ